MTSLVRKLPNLPADYLCGVRFVPGKEEVVVVGAWDGGLRLYQGDQCMGDVREEWPICSFTVNPLGIVTSTPKSLSLYDLHTLQKIWTFPLESAAYLASTGTGVWGGGWQGDLFYLDVKNRQVLLKKKLSNSIYALDVAGRKGVLSTKGNRIYCWDTDRQGQKEEEWWEERESSHRYQVTQVKINPSEVGFISASIDGRIAVDYFDLDPKIQAQKFAFKCHRVGSEEEAYPVTTLSFHPKYHTFVSGGSDGTVVTWDGTCKKRIKKFAFNEPVSAVDINEEGTLMAVATGRSMEQELEARAELLTQAQVSIIRLRDEDVRPKWMTSQ